MSKNQGISFWFISHPVPTFLITLAIMIASLCAYPLIPVAPLPQTDIPTIKVTASFPGASAETMASAVASPLENAFTGISGMSNMISSSSSERTTVTLQFNLDKNVDAAAQEVQAAINNASNKLPKDMPSLPSWKKVNPADSPVLVLTLSSEYVPLTELSDLAENIIAKQLNQIDGIAEIGLIGQQRPAIKVSVHPDKLSALNLTMSEIRSRLQKSSVNKAKGSIYGENSTIVLRSNDQLFTPEDYKNLIIKISNGQPVYLRDIADVSVGSENSYVRSWPEGKSGLSIEINRQPGANIIRIADTVRAMLPQLQNLLPKTVRLGVLNDRTRTIRSSLNEIKITFIITLVLVLTVMAAFLKRISATLIVAIVLVCSVVAALGIMFLSGFSLNNLTLVALVVAIGFIVDDAIVIVENIHRHMESGTPPYKAAAEASKEMFFTLTAITLSLAAAFIPLFFMGGIVGRLFYEFAATITVTIIISVIFSLTLAPMLCAHFMQAHPKKQLSKSQLQKGYEKNLLFVFKRQKFVLICFVLVLISAAWGLMAIPKGFFPLQDIAFISGSTQAAEDISFEDMVEKHKRLAEIIADDPAILTYTHAVGDKKFTSMSNGRFWLILKDRKDRDASAEEVIERLRPKLAAVAGIKMSLRAVQDMNFGISQTTAQYLYTLKSADISKLYFWADKLTEAMEKSKMFSDVRSDLQLGARIQTIEIDRNMAAGYGLSADDVDEALYDSFGQRQVGEYQTQQNQYHVVLGLDNDNAGKTDSLNYFYLRSPTNGNLVPLSVFAHIKPVQSGAVVINRDGQLPAVNISFNASKGVSLGEAIQQIENLKNNIRMPPDIIGIPQGSAKEFASSLKNETFLIFMAIVSIYIILGILYESFWKQLIIISTIPSGIIGVVLFLYLWNMDFSIMALIGMIMLIGIVMKNGILMVDTANKLQLHDGVSLGKAAYLAATIRFRPIMMTSIAAMLAAVPLILGQGTGAELRQPLGVSIVGGLLVSQFLTLFTTPIIYIFAASLKEKICKFNRP